jgi:hypothetical protein
MVDEHRTDLAVGVHDDERVGDPQGGMSVRSNLGTKRAFMQTASVVAQAVLVQRPGSRTTGIQ